MTERFPEGRWPRVISASLLLAALVLAGCGGRDVEKKPPAPVEVATLTLHAGDVPVEAEFVGQTESSQQVEIRARVAGYLDKRLYTEGAMVEPGQPLFQIDPKPFEAQLAAAKAELAEQDARLLNARADLKRVRPLAARDAVSQRELDSSIGNDAVAAAAVAAARAKVLQTELDLSYTRITSPVRGLSSFAKQQPGSYISTTNSLLTYVAALDPMRVNFSLSENETLQLRSRQRSGEITAPADHKLTVNIVLADGSRYPHGGQITFSDASFSESTGSFLVRAEFPNPGGLLRPGQFVRVFVSGISRTNAFKVPQKAVQQGPRGPFVWLVKDGKAEQRPVETGPWSGDDWVIRNGLGNGDVVIVDGFMRIAPGLPVVPVAPVPAAAPAAPRNS